MVCSIIFLIGLTNRWFNMVQSFDHGYYLLVKSIQELRAKKGLVTVGIGGPSGSGKTRYACHDLLLIIYSSSFLLNYLRKSSRVKLYSVGFKSNCSNSCCKSNGPRSLAEKVASVIGCTVVSMENYRVGVDEGNDLDTIDFDTLVQNLEVCMCFSFRYCGILSLHATLA